MDNHLQTRGWLRSFAAITAAVCTLGALAVVPGAMADEADNTQTSEGTAATEQSQTVVATVGGTNYESIGAAVTAVNESTDEMPTFTLAAATDESITFTHKVAVTATSKDFAYSGAMRFTGNAGGSTVSNMSFKLDPAAKYVEKTEHEADETHAEKWYSYSFVSQNVIVSGVEDVVIKGNTFAIDSGDTTNVEGKADWQPSSVWLEHGANGTVIGGDNEGDANTFNIGQVVNHSAVGVNLVGGSNQIKNTTIKNNTVNAGPTTGDGSSGSMMFVVGNGNTQQGSYGISGLTVSGNTVNNNTGLEAGKSRVYGVSVTATTGTKITENNNFQGYAAVAYSAWPNQGPNDDMTVSGNTVDAYVGVLMGDLVTDGGMTAKDNEFTETVKIPFYGNSVSVIDEKTNKTYSSIAKAIENKATDVKLLHNVTESVTIPADKTVTLDLNGSTLTNTEGNHTITNNGALTVKDSVGGGVVDNVSHAKGALENTGTAIIEGGKFTRSKEAGSSATNNGGNSWYVIDNNKGTLTINDGEVTATGKYSSLVRNLEGTMTVNGGTFSNNFIALKNDDKGTLVITGGSITSPEQAVQNWYNATITGGTLTGNVIGWAYKGQPSNTTIEGGTIAGDVKAVNYMIGGQLSSDVPTVTITGGTINGTVSKGTYNNGIVAADPSADSSKILISGGTFTNETKPDKELLAPGFVVNGNGTVTKPSTGGNGGGSTVSPSKPEVVTPPTNTDVSYGGELDLSGLKVDFGDGKTAGPDAVTVSGYDPSKPGVQEVTLASREDPSKTVTIEVLVMFKDVDESTPHHEEIRTLLEKDITRGFPDGTFQGMGSLNRQDLAAFLYRMAGEPDYEPAKADFVFADVDESTPHYREILWAAKHGVVEGFTAADGTRTFGGYSPILRQDLAAMLWRLAGEPDAGGASFPDVTEATPHATAVEWAKSAGVTTGFEDGTFRGGQTIVRQDAAAFLGRVIDRDLVKF